MVVIKKSPEKVKFLRIRSKCVKSKVVMSPWGDGQHSLLTSDPFPQEIAQPVQCGNKYNPPLL